MPEHQETGNPVFDYRADFRSFSDSLQRVLLLSGAMCFVFGGLFYFLVPTSMTLHVSMGLLGLTGPVLMLLGVAWGFYWRRKLRREFRTKFGPRE